MRKWLLIALLLLPMQAAAQVTLVEDGRGYLGVEGNEATVGSKLDDPSKVRLTSPITDHGGGGGALSFNLHRFLGKAFGSQQVEMAMIRVEQASDVRGSFSPKAEFNFLLNDGSGGDDAAMTKPLAFTAHNITRLDPGIARDLAARLGPYLATGGSRFTSPNGVWWLQLQDDGNCVIYDASNPNAPRPVFDLWWLQSVLASMGHPYPR